MRRIISLLMATCLIAISSAQELPKHYAKFAEVLGKAGTLNADGSYRVNLPRTDVEFTNANGMSIPADMGLVTYIALSGSSEKLLAVGDVAMLSGEIDGVIDALRKGGFELVSLHNHMSAEDPKLYFMHFQASGTAEQLATTFRSATGLLGKAPKASKVKKLKKPMLDVEKLSATFGSKAQVFPSGVVRFSRPRKDITLTVDGEKFLPGMGLASWAAFSACECGKTMVMGDTCCVREDLQAVIDAYRNAGIHITSIHNHTLGGSHEVIFMHYEAEGDSADIAASIVACWSLLGH